MCIEYRQRIDPSQTPDYQTSGSKEGLDGREYVIIISPWFLSFLLYSFYRAVAEDERYRREDADLQVLSCVGLGWDFSGIQMKIVYTPDPSRAEGSGGELQGEGTRGQKESAATEGGHGGGGGGPREW